MGDRLSVNKAAELLGVSATFLRYQMDVGAWDIGSVTKTRGGRRGHIIFRAKLEKLLGRELKEGEI